MPNSERSSAAICTACAHASTSGGASAAGVARPMRTRAPGRAPVSADAGPVEFSGSQTTRSGISVIRSGSSTEPAGPVTARTSPSFTPVSAAVAGDRRALGRVPGAGQGVVAVLQQTLVEQQAVPREDRLPGGRPRQPPGRSQGFGGPRPVPGPSRSSSRACGALIRQAQADVQPSASICSTRASAGARRRVIWSGFSAASKRPDPALPVEERAGLLGDRGDREDHIREFGDLAGPQFQGDQEADLLEGVPRPRRVGQVGHLDARDQQGLSSPAAAASTIWPVSRP